LALETRSRQSEQQRCENCTRAHSAKVILAVPERLANGRVTALIELRPAEGQPNGRFEIVVDAIVAIDEWLAALGQRLRSPTRQEEV